ncbi:amidinotransferase [Streptosporangiaceae bacterium NEAU-GS5]|nr:amidinotransferase [Streptosporangiaceae bacterium NEAU-GS5]
MSRIARPRHYLMCKPTFFDVRYSINPWMDPSLATSNSAALGQWKWVHDLLVDLGHHVEHIQPIPDLPDMVFAANGATVVDGKALVARFRHAERADEAPAYVEWFRRNGFREVRQAAYVNEGEGDFLTAGRHILAGSGFRSDPAACREVAEFFGREVLALNLVDPRFYHLDTALAVLDDDEIMYNPRAFCPESRDLLAQHYPDALLVDEEDALGFGLNAVSDGLHVVVSDKVVRLGAQLAERGFHVIGTDTTELMKSGGSVKCCTLEIRR